MSGFLRHPQTTGDSGDVLTHQVALRPLAPGSSSRRRPPQNARVADRYSFPSNPATNPKSIVTGGKKDKYRFSVLTPRLLRYEWSDDGEFEDRVSTFANFRWFDTPDFVVRDVSDRLEISTDYFHLVYDKKEFSADGLKVTVGDDVWHYDGESYGDLGGTARTLDGANGRIGLAPGVLSKKAYAVLEDSESMLFDQGWIATRKSGRKDGYLFAYHGDHKAAIKDFYRLSGGQPVLPRWTLGNWWSRYHAYTADEYMELIDHFKRETIPLNVGVIDMDWHWVNIPAKYGSGWTGYSWNTDLFPNPPATLKELRKRGLKIALNDHPADGIRAFEDQYELVAKAMNFDTSKEAPIEFDCTSKKFLDAYFDVLKANLEKEGVDFWWIDWQQGQNSKLPGVDPLWVLNHYHYLTSERSIGNLEKPITFSRYAGPGSHRYPIGFSGDTHITWASLKFQPEFTATASNIGYGWWSHDIGGHYSGTRSNELTARWVQFGCFSPILRLHSSQSQWNSKEPWKYEPETSAVLKKFLILRHRLIPFLYTMNIRASYEHEPLIQPMYWNHTDKEAYKVPNQYYFGPDLIVAPITSPHRPSTLLAGVQAWLPAGRFVDLFHPSLVFSGDRYIRIHRPLEEIPVLAKEGTIIPLDTAATLSNGSPRPTEITILLVVGADGHFELVEEPQNEDSSVHPPLSTFTRTPISWKQKDGILVIGPEWNGSGDSKWRQWNVKLVGHTSTSAAIAARIPPEFKVSSADNGHSTLISLGNVARWAPDGFELSLGDDLQLDVVDINERVHEILYRFEIGYDIKDDLWWLIAQSGDPIDSRVKRLYELNLDDSVRDAVMEIWAADERSNRTAYGHEIWSSGEAGEVMIEDGEKKEEDYVIL
ncbi:glycoside hydrolase family 31 protein [Podospora didyma]|uniref:Glycoside hydrolase family 31 protein n=1 Tax=Podospora didyma TaxID=330526 RepID=A0AAE0U3Z4_9PEZI|nr:glycoside hydrolase family 31 protein [Podospora didyma]